MKNTKNKPIVLEKSNIVPSSNKRLLILFIPVLSALLIGLISNIEVSEDMRVWQLFLVPVLVMIECIVLMLFIRHFNKKDKSQSL